jgi:hypothetical protein
VLLSGGESSIHGDRGASDIACAVVGEVSDGCGDVVDGDLSAGADTDAMAAFYTTVLQGLSVQARDGASRASLEAVIDCAIAAWTPLNDSSDATQPRLTAPA